jgi:hypothetical protein
MAKKQNVSAVTVAAQTATVAPVVAPEATGTKAERRSAKRSAKQLRGADGKPVHKLDSVDAALAAGYVFGKHGLVQAQFTSPHVWYTFCAWRAEQEAAMYHSKAQDALANPAAYKRRSSGGNTKALQDKIAQLEALIAQLSAAKQ